MTNCNEVYTLTFGDCGENHPGMQQIGRRAGEGVSAAKLRELCKKHGGEIIDLSAHGEEACLWVVRDYLSDIKDNLMEEMKGFAWDTRAKMRGRVVNKRARHNVCFNDESQEPDIENGKGTIIAWDSVPLLKSLKTRLETLVETPPLIAEGNHYYDAKKCGIGFHGDTERRIVIGCRLGDDFPLEYQWYHQTKPVGERYVLSLGHGDMYVMSSKAVGFDWKRRVIYTLRHGAGKAYTK